MLNLPVIDYDTTPNPAVSMYSKVLIGDHHILATQKIMQKMTNEILTYLVHHGSHIKVFSMRPYWDIFRDRPKADENLHRWPKYTYLRKTMLDGQGEDRVVALPISSATRELPDAQLLTESG